MLDLKFIRENPDTVKKAVQQKRVSLNVDDLLKADQALLDLKKKNQSLNEEKNAAKCKPVVFFDDIRFTGSFEK